MVRRGGCSFVLKALRCAAAGAAAVVVEFRAGEELQNMGDPDNKAAELKIPVVAIGADDVAMLLAAPTFTMRHGEPEKGPDAWDAMAGMASKAGHDALMSKLLAGDNSGSYRAGRSGAAMELLGGETGDALKAADFDPTTGKRFGFAMKGLGSKVQQELERARGSGEKEYTPNPTALMDYVIDTFGWKAAHGYVAHQKGGDHTRAAGGTLSRTYHGRTLGGGVDKETGVVLRLERQNIDDEKMIALAEYLPLDPALTQVFLGGNKIGAEGGMAIASVVQHCPSLKVFSLAGGNPGNPLCATSLARTDEEKAERKKMEEVKGQIRAALFAPPYTMPNNFGTKLEPRVANKEKAKRIHYSTLKCPGIDAGRARVDIHKFRKKKAAAVTGQFRQTEALGAAGQKRGGRHTGGAKGLRKANRETVWGSY